MNEVPICLSKSPILIISPTRFFCFLLTVFPMSSYGHITCYSRVWRTILESLVEETCHSYFSLIHQLLTNSASILPFVSERVVYLCILVRKDLNNLVKDDLIFLQVCGLSDEIKCDPGFRSGGCFLLEFYRGQPWRI